MAGTVPQQGICEADSLAHLRIDACADLAVALAWMSRDDGLLLRRSAPFAHPLSASARLQDNCLLALLVGQAQGTPLSSGRSYERSEMPRMSAAMPYALRCRSEVWVPRRARRQVRLDRWS
jgi:hypothetical protein